MKDFMRGVEIYLNKTQSVLLLVSVVVIAALSFTLGFIVQGGDEEQRGSATQADIASQKRGVAVFQVEEASHEKSSKSGQPEQAESREKKELIAETELTFYKTLSDGPKEKKAEKTESVDKKANEQLAKKEKVKKPIKKTPIKVVKAKKKPVVKKVKKAVPARKRTDTMYTVQVGSFQSKKDAFSLKNRLERRGYDSYIMIFNKGNAKWFRVRVGAINNKDDAQALSNKINSEESLNTYIATYDR